MPTRPPRVMTYHPGRRKRLETATRPTAARRGYGSKWRKARSHFLARHPLCAECGEAATVVDHIVPHRGDMDKFWDVNNWQALCRNCHQAKTARGE